MPPIFILANFESRETCNLQSREMNLWVNGSGFLLHVDRDWPICQHLEPDTAEYIDVKAALLASTQFGVVSRLSSIPVGISSRSHGNVQIIFHDDEE